MTLLKGDGTAPVKTQKVSVSAWPIERLPEGIGLSVKDGWYFGIGFGSALIIALPIIMLILSCIVFAGLSILGTSFLGGF